MLCGLGGQPVFGRIIKQALSTDQMKRFGEVNESDEHGNLLFSAPFLEMAKGKDHVYR